MTGTRLARLVAVAAVSACLAACGDDPSPVPQRQPERNARAAAHVIAVVRSKGWLEEMARTAGTPVFIHAEPLVGDLVVVYARDSGASASYLTKEQVDALGGSPAERMRRGVRTLQTLLPDLERDEVAKGVYALQGDPNYVPSLLLMDDLWQDQIAVVKGDLVAVVPTRQVILFTGSEHPGAVRRMRELAATAAAEARYPISEVLLRRWGGKWIAFE